MYVCIYIYIYIYIYSRFLFVPGGAPPGRPAARGSSGAPPAGCRRASASSAHLLLLLSHLHLRLLSI